MITNEGMAAKPDGRESPPVKFAKTTHPEDDLPFFSKKSVFFEIKVVTLHQISEVPDQLKSPIKLSAGAQ